MKQFRIIIFIIGFAVLCLAQSPGAGVAWNTNIVVANAATTGTTLDSLAKFTGAPSAAVITATTDTAGIVGIVTAGAGTTGSATIATTGNATCNFSGATTAGHYVINSTAVGGDCEDAGATIPTGNEVLGVVTATIASAGTANVMLGGVGAAAGSGPAVPVSITNGGTGTGSTLTGLVRGSGTAMTAAELSGDATTSGSNAVTVSKINGTAFSGTATHLVAFGTGGTIPADSGIADSTTGSGSIVLATSPTLVTPALGTPSAIVLTNATGLPVGGIAALTANTVVGNGTGLSASPTALAVPSCSATGSALEWTSGTGFGCVTHVASLTGDGHIITNSASTGATTLSIAGTSGGIPYFSSASAWQSSAALASTYVVEGGGAGAAPATSAHLYESGGAQLNYTGATGINVTGQVEVQTLGAATATAVCISGGVLSTCSSLGRYKANKTLFSPADGLRTVMALRPKTYTSLTNLGRDDEPLHQVGVIAEDAVRANPRLGAYNDGKLVGVDVEGIAAADAAAIQQLQAEIVALRKQLGLPAVAPKSKKRASVLWIF